MKVTPTHVARNSPTALIIEVALDDLRYLGTAVALLRLVLLKRGLPAVFPRPEIPGLSVDFACPSLGCVGKKWKSG